MEFQSKCRVTNDWQWANKLGLRQITFVSNLKTAVW